MAQQTAVEWLAEKYNYVTWMRNHDEISAGKADEWRKHYLEQAKQMEREQMFGFTKKFHIIGECTNEFYTEEFIQYYNKTYGK